MAATLAFKARVAGAGSGCRGCYGSVGFNKLSGRPAGRSDSCPARVALSVVASARPKARAQPRIAPPELARVDVLAYDGTPIGQEELRMRTAGGNSEHVVHRKLIQVSCSFHTLPCESQYVRRRFVTLPASERQTVEMSAPYPFAILGNQICILFSQNQN